MTHLSSVRRLTIAGVLLALAPGALGSPAEASTPQGSAGSTQSNPSLSLDRIDQRDLPLSRSYSWTTKAENVHVYVVDTAIHGTHVDFEGRVTEGVDLVGGPRNSDVCFFSGTATASLVGGAKYGAAKGVQLKSVRVRDCWQETTPARVVAGINWVTAHAQRPAVAVLPFVLAPNNAVDEAIRKSVKSGVSWVTSASGAKHASEDACSVSPARVSEAITATPLDVALSSTTGDVLRGDARRGPCVDVAAPSSGPTAMGPGNGQNLWDRGGSDSAYTAGAAALLLGEHPTWTPTQVHQELVRKSTKDKLNPGTIGATPNRILYTGAA